MIGRWTFLCATIARMNRKLPPPLALVYHAVGEVSPRRDPHGLFVRPKDLRWQIERLTSWGYETVTFGELARKAKAGTADGFVALTFDDGYVDNLDVLVPILNEYSATATVFVVSSWFGKDHPVTPWERILTSDEVRELHRSGIEIGSHTRTHPDLTSITYEEALAEWAESKVELEGAIGAPVAVAAYPFGSADPDAVHACREAGYEAAGRTSGNGAWHKPHELPRQDMDSWSTRLGLRLKRSDHYEGLMRFKGVRAFRRLSRKAKSGLK
jgi:peptidoglycan/xylan/chitin deacetylase (PgdA/CDA1 family)